MRTDEGNNSGARDFIRLKNHLKVITTTSNQYADIFGFTEGEVFASLEEYGLSEQETLVKHWYDGFTFGSVADIYNPWSIINFLDSGKFAPYWANTSSNRLVAKLIQRGSKGLKRSFERLLRGQYITTYLDEQIVYDQLEHEELAIWSLLLASGYLKVVNQPQYDGWGDEEPEYELALTNHEVKVMFRTLIRGWFGNSVYDYNDFIQSLLSGDVEAMNQYINRIALRTFRFFDVGGTEPERFYHGFVLGLIVELEQRYVITSNRESGYGRYDVMLKPLRDDSDAIIIEFKVFNPRKEQTLIDTAEKALRQIEGRCYEADLLANGIAQERIRTYGFAFRGQEVLAADRVYLRELREDQEQR